MKSIYNIELLIRGVDSFRKSGKRDSLSVELQIIDDYPQSSYSTYIHEFIDREGFRDFVKVLPKLTQEEMRDHYRKCDLVIMIPSSDGTPVSAIEAMLSRKPLLLGNLDYDRDLFNQKTVWKIDDFSPDSIKDSIADLLSDQEKMEIKLENAYTAAYEKAGLQGSLAEVLKLYNLIAEDLGGRGD